MPVLLDTSRSASGNEIHASNCVTIGLINNMPDPALDATERQFVELIRAAASKTIVRLLLFSIPEIPRADTTRQDMAERYRDVSELWGAHVDGLIVTGTEPRMKNLKDEPYWATLSRVVAGAPPCHRLARPGPRATNKNPEGRAVLGHAEPGGGLGARPHNLDHLVMP